MAEPGKFSPEDVLNVHYDTVNPARREMVRIALHLRQTQAESLPADSLKALRILEPWFKNGSSSDLRSEGAKLATRISTFFRFVSTSLAGKFGGGESGLARFLKETQSRIASDPKAVFSEEEARFIGGILATAWQEHNSQAEGDGPSRRAGGAAAKRQLGWFDSLDGFGTLDAPGDLLAPNLSCMDGQTIHSQAGQSYTQWVPLHDPDSAQTICPIGHSDRSESRYRTSTIKLWAEAKLHPAPLSRGAVAKIMSERVSLTK